ncbi:flippase (plasmid) [Chromobacterium amazonense]|uniref:flippase n=1 Tax=Chromobacterium amazonense TaxID=1382803 RepID=UPI00237EBAA6|nr:flippase [Chromobacterium amazonense]MDE1713187.1 flippase [Chromobacterium amazonense]
MSNTSFKLGAAGRAIGANFGWLVADKMFRLVIGLLVSAWVARYLGPKQFGVLAYSLTFIAIFQAITLLGLDSLIVRDVAARPSQAHLYLGTAVRLRGASATASYFLMLVIAAIFHQTDENVFVTIAVAGLILFFQISDVVDLWFQSQLQSRRTVLAKCLSYSLTAFVKILLILGGAGLIAFAAATVIEAALALVAMSIAYSMFRTKARWQWSTSVAIDLLRQSWPLLISGLSILLYMRIGVIFLRESAGNSSVGIYTVGSSLSELWYFIPMAIASSLAPYVSRKRVEDGDVYLCVVYKAFSAMWILSLTVAIFNALTAKYWVALLYGEQYRNSAEIFALHTFTFIPVCLGVMQSIWLVNEGRSKLALYQAISGAIVALSLNLILTPTYGAYGAAMATVISQFVQAFLVNAFLAPDLFRLQILSLRFIRTLRS